jgi:hypothetical protein
MGPRPKQIERAAEAARLGMSYELQARYVGVSDRAYRLWRRRGEEETDGPYYDLVQAVESAEADGAAAALAAVIKAYREGSWQAAAWMLERRHGYTRTEHREVTVEDKREIAREKLAEFLARQAADNEPEPA